MFGQVLIPLFKKRYLQLSSAEAGPRAGDQVTWLSSLRRNRR